MIFDAPINNEEEVWKDIPEMEGFYQASSFGRIRSVSRVTNHNHKIKSKVLSPSKNQNGYLRVLLSFGSTRLTRHVHRLVALTFIPNPEGKKEVDHINHDNQDNRISNLRWATRSEQKGNERKRPERLFKGTKFDTRDHKGKKWSARITCNNEIFLLGSFHTEEEAARAYDEAAIIHFGEFAALNFPI